VQHRKQKGAPAEIPQKQSLPRVASHPVTQYDRKVEAAKAAEPKEMIVATHFHRNECSSKDSGTERPSAGSAIATLLGIYTALYLAVVGVLHVVTSPDAAAAVVPNVTSASIVAPAEPPIGEVNVDATQVLEPDAADEDNSRECVGGNDTSCIYN
jgi:hypothetical protein